MTPLAHGRIVLWEGASLWIFDVPETAADKSTDFHAHHAIQLVLALDGRFELRGAGSRVAGPAAAVAADARHAFAAQGVVALLFIDPESQLGESLSRSLFGQDAIAPLAPDGLGDILARLLEAFHSAGRDDTVLRALGRELQLRLGGGAGSISADSRVRDIVAWASRQLDRPVRIADAAALVGLSRDRMSHLFVEETGLPFRTYVLWLRLTKAVAHYAAGGSLTEAAHEAGFADSAHFSRTFRRMFGVAAAELRLA